MVDAWASMEQSTLNWIRHHQKELRAEVYSGLRDAALGDRDENVNLAEHSQRIILPLSFGGGECHMSQLFHDSICHHFHKPDLFLTMTANPNWPEIQDQLLQEVPPPAGARYQQRKQKASDRPDIEACVFEMKKNQLLKEINEGLFGRVPAMVHNSKREVFPTCIFLSSLIRRTKYVILPVTPSNILRYNQAYKVPVRSSIAIKEFSCVMKSLSYESEPMFKG